MKEKPKLFIQFQPFPSLMGGCLREQCTKSITLIGEIATNREMDIEYPFLCGLQSIQYGLSIMNRISIFFKSVFLLQDKISSEPKKISQVSKKKKVQRIIL